MKKLLVSLSIMSMMSFLCEAQKELAEVNAQLVISGRVVDAVTQKGLPNAKVQIKTGNSFKEATTKTDDTKTTFNEAGYFDVENVVTQGDDILVIVTPPTTDAAGTAKTYSLYIGLIDTTSATELAIRQRDLGELGIVEATGTVTGTVFGIDGPIAGVTVVLENSYRTGSPAAGDFYAETVSDANGVYTFSNVPKTSSYTIYNLPFDINSDSELDYGVATKSVSISHLTEAAARNGNLVLPTFNGPFALTYSNILQFGAGAGAAITGLQILATTTAVDFYFNKTVVDNTTLEVDCTDTLAATQVGGVTTVSTSKVTFIPTGNWILGHSYTCDITVESVIGERYDLSENIPAGNFSSATFLVLDDTSPASITDFAYDLTDGRTTYCGANTSATYTDIEKAAGTATSTCTGTATSQASLIAKFSFTIPANADFVVFYYRHNDVSNAGSEWTSLLVNEIVLPTSLAATGLAQGFIDLKDATQSQVTAGSSVAFKADLRTANAAIPTFSATRTTYLIVAACNQEQDGFDAFVAAADLNAGEISDGCTFSNVVELTSTR